MSMDAVGIPEQTQESPTPIIKDEWDRVTNLDLQLPETLPTQETPETAAQPETAPQPLIPADWSPQEEELFQGWYSAWAGETRISPNPDDPRHMYDYRSAYRAGAVPMPDAQGEFHWPSEFKQEGHPNQIIDGVDTRTGEPVAKLPRALYRVGIEAPSEGIRASLTYLAAASQHIPIHDTEIDTMSPTQRADVSKLMDERGWESGEEYREAAKEVLRADRASTIEALEATRGVLPELSEKQVYEGGVAGWLEKAGVGVAQFAPTMGMMFVPGGQAASVMAIYTMVGGMAYDEYLKEGVDPGRAFEAANLRAMLETPVEFAGNVIQVGRIAKLFGKGTVGLGVSGIVKKYVETIVTNAAAEGMEEVGQEFLGVIADVYAANPGADPVAMAKQVMTIWKDPEFLKGAGTAFALGATGSAMMSGAGVAVSAPTQIPKIRQMQKGAREFADTVEKLGADTATMEELKKGFEESQPGHPVIEALEEKISTKAKKPAAEKKAPAEEAVEPEAQPDKPAPLEDIVSKATEAETRRKDLYAESGIPTVTKDVQGLEDTEVEPEYITGMAFRTKDGRVISGKDFQVEGRTHADIWERMSPEEQKLVDDDGGVITSRGR
jgi:hypothetical protein